MRRFLKITHTYLVRLLQPDVKNPAIILLGDSLIKLGKWKTLLNRKDLINRGIGGDTLHQIQSRMNDLSHTTARIVFIEGGINDLPQADPNSLFTQFQEIIEFWESRQVIPVVTSLVYISPKAGKKYPWRSDWMSINNQVSIVNECLKIFCSAQQIDFLDLNPLLSSSNQLRPENTTDGVHLTESAYRIWAGEVMKIVQRHQI